MKLSEERKMTVRVYSGSVLVEMKVFVDEVKAVKWASYFQDNGYKVRIED
jgi:hypothetical protein